MPAAFTTAMLAWGLLAFPSGYAKADLTMTAMEEVKWGTDYLLKTFRNSNDNITLVYQVGNLTADTSFWAPPENMTQQSNPRPVYTINAASGASDLAGQMVGAFASAAIVQSKLNSTGGQNGTYYATLMDAATLLYGVAKEYPGRYTQKFNYNCLSPYAKSRIGSNTTVAPCVAPTSFSQGSAMALYNSTTFYDDLVWAASWLYYATGNYSYLTDAQNFYSLHINEESQNDGQLITDWNNMYWASNVLLANLTGTGAYHDAVQSMLKQWICGTNGQIRFTPRGRAWNTADGSTGVTQMASFLSLVYGEMKSELISGGQQARYICFSRTQVRYMLGDAGRSLMAGFGKSPPTHLQNRAASCATTNACTRDNALFVSTPNPHVLKGATPQFATFSDSYEDVRTSNDSRVDIGTNVAVTSTSVGLTDAPGTWEQCLQGFGVLTGDTAVCNQNI